MWAWTTTGKGAQEEHGDVHIAVVGPDELIRAALEGQILLANAIHPAASRRAPLCLADSPIPRCHFCCLITGPGA
jgi:hypothetical protein